MKRFQSLTGSIHTQEYLTKLEVNTLVSIPHRFNSHKLGNLLPPFNCLGFNPSQVQFTPKNKNTKKITKISFNPSQVQFTPIKLIKFLSPKKLVSIPHRFNSHKKLLEEIGFEAPMFQSLTGSIHTRQK